VSENGGGIWRASAKLAARGGKKRRQCLGWRRGRSTPANDGAGTPYHVPHLSAAAHKSPNISFFTRQNCVIAAAQTLKRGKTGAPLGGEGEGKRDAANAYGKTRTT